MLEMSFPFQNTNGSILNFDKDFYANLNPFPYFKEIFFQGDRNLLGNPWNGFGKFEYENKNIYHGDIKEGIPNGNGIILYTNGSRYEGIFDKGKLNGFGSSYNNGETYQGEFINGIENGYGKKTYCNGCVLQGKFIDGFPVGKGKISYLNGDIYEGSIKNEIPNGSGTYFHHNGDKYVGGFLNGVAHRRGKYYYNNHSLENPNYFEGIFIQNKACIGKRIYPNGDIFESEKWVNDRICGEGSFKNEKENIEFEGEWNDGKIKKGDLKKTFFNPNSNKNEVVHFSSTKWKNLHDAELGTIIFPDKIIYQGGWTQLKRYGKGTLKNQNDNTVIYKGNWENDYMNDKNGIFYEEKGKFQGHIVNNQYVKGLFTFKDKDKDKDTFQGTFLENNFEEGKFTWKNGDSYQGKFLNNIPHGYGEKTFFSNGNTIKGNWTNGVLTEPLVIHENPSSDLVATSTSDDKSDDSSSLIKQTDISNLGDKISNTKKRNRDELEKDEIGRDEIGRDEIERDELINTIPRKRRPVEDSFVPLEENQEDVSDNPISENIIDLESADISSNSSMPMETVINDVESEIYDSIINELVSNSTSNLLQNKEKKIVEWTEKNTNVEGYWIGDIPIGKHFIKFDFSSYYGEVKYDATSKNFIYHGNGNIKTKEYIFIGQWNNGVKIGDTKIILSDGTTIKGSVV